MRVPKTCITTKNIKIIPNENLNILDYNIVAEIDRLDFPVGLIGINQSSYAVKFLTSIEARRARGVLITIAHDECIFCASSQNMHHDRKYFLSIYSIEGLSSQGKTAWRNRVFTLVEVRSLKVS